MPKNNFHTDIYIICIKNRKKILPELVKKMVRGETLAKILFQNYALVLPGPGRGRGFPGPGPGKAKISSPVDP